MKTHKLIPGKAFPKIAIPTIDYGTVVLGQPEQGWELIVVYRGLHCPQCRKYINRLHSLVPQFLERDIHVIAISADHEDKAVTFKREAGYHHLPIGYQLSIEQMKKIGVYISDPRSPEETDRPFAEPAIFLINPAQTLQIVDYSNAPFCRPDLEVLLNGIIFIQDHQYPIRGRHL